MFIWELGEKRSTAGPLPSKQSAHVSFPKLPAPPGKGGVILTVAPRRNVKFTPSLVLVYVVFSTSDFYNWETTSASVFREASGPYQTGRNCFQGKVSAARPEHLSWIPGMPIVDGKN